MWRIWWAPNNASKWQVGFNSVFKGLMPSWFLEKKKVTHNKFSVARECIITFCFKPQIHAHTKQSEQVHCHGGETNHPSPLHVQTIFQNTLNWPKLSKQHVSTFTERDSFVPKESFPHWMEIFISFASQSSPQEFSFCNRSHFFWT